MRTLLALPALIGLAAVGFSATATAQVNHQFPGASSGQFAPPPTTLPPPIPPGGTQTQSYPNTESFARDRAVSQGYKVQRMERQVDGAWRAETGRNTTSPKQPLPETQIQPQRQSQRQGVPTKVTIFPDGRMVEEY